MEIAKAIEILCDLQAGIIPPAPQDMFSAIKMGEDACKRIQLMRESSDPALSVPLKNEDEIQRYVPDPRD